jgi:prepilin-type N-terminal cleavage/methylation domain-containing protein
MSISSKHYRTSSRAPASPLRAIRGGFTLIELIVVVAVITIITALVLFSQNKFNSATLLRSLAYSVALSISEAQSYGTSVRGTTSINFAPSYGVYFDTSDLSLSPQQYFIFADSGNGGGGPSDGQYETGEGLPAELVPKNYVISQFCAVTAVGQDCYPSSPTGQSLTSLTIYFKRPNPDACIASSANPTVCGPGGSSPYTSAYIVVTSSGGGDIRAVKITNPGQLTVCALNALPGGTIPC